MTATNSSGQQHVDYDNEIYQDMSPEDIYENPDSTMNTYVGLKQIPISQTGNQCGDTKAIKTTEFKEDSVEKDKSNEATTVQGNLFQKKRIKRVVGLSVVIACFLGIGIAAGYMIFHTHGQFSYVTTET